MISNDRFTSTETEQLLRHALESSPQLTKQRLAHDLGVLPPRISEGLRGAWRLNGDLKQRLIEKYGQPRGKPGRYVRAEVADSIACFLEDEEELSRKRHLATVLKTLNDKAFLGQLAQGMAPPQSGEYFLERSPLSPREISGMLFKVEQFLLSAKFSEWLGEVRQGYQRLVSDQASPRILEEYFRASTFYDIDQIATLDMKGKPPVPSSDDGLEAYANAHELAFQSVNGLDLAAVGATFLALRDDDDYRSAGLNRPLSLSQSSKPSKLISLPEPKEFVLTGDRVWQVQDRFKTPKLGEPFSKEAVFRIPGDHPEQILSPTFERHGRLDVPYRPNGANWNVDCWTTYRIELFLNQDCNYSLLIELGKDPQLMLGNDFHLAQRIVLIPKILGRDLLDHLNAFRDWLGLEELPELTIKEEIARAGGYVPGTTII